MWDIKTISVDEADCGTDCEMMLVKFIVLMRSEVFPNIPQLMVREMGMAYLMFQQGQGIYQH